MPWRAATWLDPEGNRILLLVIHHAAVDGRTARLILDGLVTGVIDVDVTETKRVNCVTNANDEKWWVDRVREMIGDQPLPMIEFDDADRRSIAMDAHGGEVFADMISFLDSLKIALRGFHAMASTAAQRLHAMGKGRRGGAQVNDNGIHPQSREVKRVSANFR